jgi:tRNA (guanine-N7-)-methyltransferase
LVEPDSVLDPLDFPAWFGRPVPIEVELGSGDGGFLMRYAELHPDTGFVGVERLLGRIRKLERKAPRRGLKNVRGVRFDAPYLAQYLIVPATIQAFHIYFPDPWPKKRHRRRRLVNATLVQALHQALVPGGHVYLRTDDADYHSQMVTVFGGASGFVPCETPESLRVVLTDFEQTFLAQGKPTLRAAYQKSG